MSTQDTKERERPDSPAPAPVPAPGAAERDLEALRQLLTRSTGPASWKAAELLTLPRLYRRACTVLARLEQDGENPRLLLEARTLVARAHALLVRERPRPLAELPQRLAQVFLRRSPRAIRAEWRLLALSLLLLYGLALLAWIGVSRDLDLAYSLLDPAAVETEMQQLADTAAGQPFRGNFTFGLGESPVTAGWIMLHNIGIGILFFASALLPPLYLYLLATNALMLGTYTAVAGHWGQAGAISSILWTHGVLEIQSIVLVGTAGLVLVRAWVRPGAYTRRHALVRESGRALELLAPVFPLLVIAGLIEGFISPHAPLGVRLAVALLSGLGLIAWVALGGRERPGAARPG